MSDRLLLGLGLAAAAVAFQSWGVFAAALAAGTVVAVGIRGSMPAPVALAVSAAAGAALVHFAVAPEHFREWWGFGTFFVLCGEAQFGWAVTVRRQPGRGVLAFGLGASILLVVLWALSRSMGLPFGPDPGVAEPVGTADLVTVCLELLTAAACAWALLDRGRVSASRQATLFRVAGLALLATATGWGLLSVAG